METMIDRAAPLMVKRCGADAMLEASQPQRWIQHILGC
jgi:hypothetical protein